jgi:hypothetical protein
VNVYYHRGAMGDIVHSLVAVRTLGKGVYVTALNKERHDSLATLLRLQRYITDVEHCRSIHTRTGGWKPDHVTHDMNLPAYLPTDCDLIKAHHVKYGVQMFRHWSPWLDPDPTWTSGKCDRAVVNRTFRYRNPKADWKAELAWLRANYAEVAFVGTREESLEWDLPWIETPTVADLARVIYESRYFAGNQSLAFTIALGYGVQHTLETAPNHFQCIYPCEHQRLLCATS